MLERSLSQARVELAELANRVGYGGARVVLTRRGRPVAALVSTDDLASLLAVEEAADGLAQATDSPSDEELP